jgi:hypothetical protein
MVFGHHLIIDANECEGDITNKNHIQNFINDLVILGNMKKKGDTIFEFFDDTPFNRENDLIGYSVCQIISLSNITLHINFISKTVYYDFFTCGNINEEEIIGLFKKYFNPKTIKKIILNREAKDLTLPFY